MLGDLFLINSKGINKTMISDALTQASTGSKLSFRQTCSHAARKKSLCSQN